MVMMRLVASIAIAFALAGCNRAPTTSGPLSHDVYVWQRAWNANVRGALEKSGSSMHDLVLFAGQISPADPRSMTIRVPIDYLAAKQTGRPIGLAIRIEPYPGPFRPDDAIIKAVVDLAKEQLTAARRGGVEPVELQIDFDCAESKLAGYAIWLKAIRTAVAPLKVCPTVLPSWLKRPEFKPLAEECGQYVLQVHCVAPPRELATLGSLTDPARAREWVSEAANVGVPFRVALPTYSYLVAFDGDGQPRGVSAEGPSSRWPADAHVERWEAQPAALARLVADWTQSRPAALQGIIWFRLPVEGDALNWRWTTLQAVMQGRMPTSSLRLEASTGQPSDLTLVNDGEQDEVLPERIEASWEGSPVSAADALQDYELERPKDFGANRLLFHRRSGSELSRLPPGSRHPIGWIRCESANQIRLAIVSPAAGAGVRHSSGNPAIGTRHGD
jgi:hypothetical protein